MLIAQLTEPLRDPTYPVAFFAVVLLLCFFIWRFLRWVREAPSAPDPWDEKVSAEMDAEDSAALCHRCLEPHDDRAHFCPHCGAAVGQFTNVLPFDYLFTVGDALRVGTRGEFKRTPLTVIGYFLFALAEYSLLAPVYWGFLVYKLFSSSGSAPPTNSTPPVSSSSNGN